MRMRWAVDLVAAGAVEVAGVGLAVAVGVVELDRRLGVPVVAAPDQAWVGAVGRIWAAAEAAPA